MAEQELKDHRIDQARINHEMAEANVDKHENNPDSPEYFTAMCDSIILEQVYDQVINYYQVKIQITKEQALIELGWRMRKKYFQIRRHRKEIEVLERKMRNIWNNKDDELEKMQIQYQIIGLTISIGEMTRQAAAFEFRSMESINAKK